MFCDTDFLVGLELTMQTLLSGRKSQGPAHLCFPSTERTHRLDGIYPHAGLTSTLLMEPIPKPLSPTLQL